MPKSSKIRVAVVAAGAIAQRRHLPEFQARPDVEIVAIVDPNLSRAKEVAEQFGAEAGCDTLAEALTMGLDAVSVCSPNNVHAAQSIEALKGGAHVLCEKPMAATMNEARAMIRAAKAAGKQLMIAHNQRTDAAHVKAKELLKSGIVGKCVAFSTAFSHGGPERWSIDGAKGFFFKKNQAVVGSMGDLGVHKLDLIRWMLDDEVALVGSMCATQSKARCDVEDTAFATVKMKSGILGQMFAGWISTKPSNESATILYCKKGEIRVHDDPAHPIVVVREGGEKIFVHPPKQANSGVIDGFVDAIGKGRKVPIPGEEGARSLAAVIACMESSTSGRFVKPAKV